ncbi:hypothetical protein B0H34DRAFT_732192, partial [Crassisporium funariophilum]
MWSSPLASRSRWYVQSCAADSARAGWVGYLTPDSSRQVKVFCTCFRLFPLTVSSGFFSQRSTSSSSSSLVSNLCCATTGLLEKPFESRIIVSVTLCFHPVHAVVSTTGLPKAPMTAYRWNALSSYPWPGRGQDPQLVRVQRVDDRMIMDVVRYVVRY